jgi:hypothetical protein
METAFFIGCIIGIILMGFALFASFSEFDNDRWRNKGY